MDSRSEGNPADRATGKSTGSGAIAVPFERSVVSEYLERFVSDQKLSRMRQVLAQRTRRLTVVLEDLYHPHNVSACLRSCECFGVQDVHIVGSDRHWRDSVKISRGAGKWLSVHRYPPAAKSQPEPTQQQPPGMHSKLAAPSASDHTPMARCLANLRADGFRLYAMSLSEDALPIDGVPVTEHPAAMIFGTEWEGVSAFVEAEADAIVTIPMVGFTESLNVSVAVALAVEHLAPRARNCPDGRLTATECSVLWERWLRHSVRNVDLHLKNAGLQ